MADAVRGAVRGDTNALRRLQSLDARAVPELCQLLTNTALTRFETRVATYRPWVPAPVRGFLPDSGERVACAKQAARLLVRLAPWGDAFPAVVRAACQPGAARTREGEWCPIISAAATQVSRNPGRYSETNTIATFVAGLTNGSAWIRVDCVRALSALGPAATNALPALRDRLHDPGITVAQHAAHAIWRISGERREPLELLLSSLGTWNLEVLKAASMRLVQIAPGAAPALPRQQELLAPRPAVSRSVPGLPYYCGPGSSPLWDYLAKLGANPDADLAAAAKAAHGRLRAAGITVGVQVPE